MPKNKIIQFPAGAVFEARERLTAVPKGTRVSKDIREIADYAGVDARRLAAVLRSIQQ